MQIEDFSSASPKIAVLIRVPWLQRSGDPSRIPPLSLKGPAKLEHLDWTSTRMVVPRTRNELELPSFSRRLPTRATTQFTVRSRSRLRRPNADGRRG